MARKPTKLGYCATCPKRIMVFDTDGRPFKVTRDYCEVLFGLSNESRTRIAFCKRCLSKELDAKEVIANVIDGMKENVGKKAWDKDLKDWYLKNYEDLEIVKILKSVGVDPKEPIRFNRIPFKNIGINGIKNTGKIKPKKDNPLPVEALKRMREKHATS